VHRPAVVAEVALELAEHRRHRVGGERGLPRRVEAVDRLDQPERGDLHEVVEWLVGAPVAPRHAAGERQEARDELLARGLVAVAVIADEETPVLLRAREIGGLQARPPWRGGALVRGLRAGGRRRLFHCSPVAFPVAVDLHATRTGPVWRSV
jgi:hypothetical protein